MIIRNNMEKLYNNTNTIYSKYKIKKTIVDLLFSLIPLGGIVYLIIFLINVLVNLDKGNDLYNTYYSMFLTLIVIIVLLGIFAIGLVTILIITIIKHINVLNYYKVPRFKYKQTINFEFDYKLWQTAKKHSFHSQVLRIKLDDTVIERKSRVIFTNHERIGLFKIPLVLQSHTYKKEKYIVAYDEVKDEIVVIDI